MDDEVGEEELALAAGQAAFDALVADTDDQRSAELDPRPALLQGSPKVEPTASAHNRNGEGRESDSQSADSRVEFGEQRRKKMAMVVDCECGQQIRAESEDALVAKVTEHVEGNHPELVGKLSREDVVAMANEE
jgi:hypothetical protein